MFVRRHGVSRSATVILAWVMASESKSVTAAMAQLASVRPQCRPNPGFWRQLNLFQVTFLHYYTYTTIFGLVLIPCPVAEYGLPSGARQCPLYLLLPAARLLPGVPGPLGLAWARLQVLPLPSCPRCPVTGQLDSLTHYQHIQFTLCQVLEHSEGVSPDWCPALEASSAPAPRCRRGVFIVELRNNRDQPSSRAPAVARQRLDCHKCGHKVGNRGLASCGCGAVLARAAWLNLSKVDPPSNV